jgi:RNA polymerase sigma-70 factor (ECF subfamily)
MPSTANHTSTSTSSGEPTHSHASSSPGASSATSNADQALLQQIAAGNEEALRQLYAAYRPRLWRFVSERVDGDSDVINTVLQEVFLSVWRTAGRYRGEASVATWLFSMTRNLVSSARRSTFGTANQRSVVSAWETGEEQEQSDLGELESPEQAIVDRLSVREAFSCLSPKYREVVDLVFWHGFTYEETGHILNIPLGTVKSRLNAARQLLATALAEGDAEPC